MKSVVVFFLIGSTLCLSGQVTPKLVYGTYVGTGPGSLVKAMAADIGGFAYVGGRGPGSDPNTYCQFLTKLNQSGTAAVWNVCLPIGSVDAMAVDAQGFLYIVGFGPYSSGVDGIVLKLSPDSSVHFSRPIAGYQGGKIAVDQAGSVYLIGAANSRFQPTPGAYSLDPSNFGFAAKLNPDGSFAYATFQSFGTYSLAADSVGRLWIGGDFCLSPKNCSRSGTAASIAQLDASGSKVLFSKSFGGGPRLDLPQFGSINIATSVAVAPDDAVWVLGSVELPITVPITPGAVSPTRPANSIAGYVLKLSSSGELMYGSYLNAPERLLYAAVDGQGNLFAATNGGTSTISGISTDGTRLLFSTEFNGSVNSISLDPNGGLYVAGSPTVSLNNCPTTPNAYQPTPPTRGNSIGCVGRLDLYQTTDAQIFYPLNAASVAPSSVAPGEVITMFGQNLPSSPAVTFDGIPAPIVSSDAGQITAVVPFGINPSWTALSVDGVGGYMVPAWPSAPGLFTVDASSGTGQLDARNADGSVNASDNPAAAGSVVSVFMTGAGAMTPALTDGQLGPVEPPYATPVLPIYASVNGVPATVVLAVQAPGKVAGIVRVDIQIPADAASGDAVVKIGVGNSSDPASFPFQPRTTIAVQ